MVSFADKPLLEVATAAAWEQWILRVGHPNGVQLAIAASPVASL